MITGSELSKALVDCGVSIDEFSRKSGIGTAKLKKFCVDGVPTNMESHISQMISDAKKAIFFGEQIDIEDVK